MDGMNLKETFDIYVKFLLADAAFYAVITVGALCLFFAFHVLKRYFENKKGGRK
jgi:hypothetical protein